MILRRTPIYLSKSKTQPLNQNKMERNYIIKVNGQYVVLTEGQYEQYLIYGI